MGDRYYITGVQLGMLLAFSQTHMPKKTDELIEDIIEKQYLGTAEELNQLLIRDKR